MVIIMKKLSLDGIWKITLDSTGESVESEIPVTDFNAFYKSAKISDPFYGTNENEVQFIGKTGKSFERKFNVSSDILENENIILSCDMLDTLAAVYINSKLIGKSENAYVKFEKDIKSVLNEGENEIKIHFDSPVEYITKRQKEKPLPKNNNGTDGAAYIRKTACHFGWDWGINLPVSGILGKVQILAFNNEVRDFTVFQKHENGAVTLEIETDIKADRTGELTLPNGKKNTFEVKDGTAVILISNPELWWTRELSNKEKQPLYTIKIDSAEKRIGLRTIKLDRKADKYGHNFRFILNGVPIFAKGANVIPPDAMADRIDEKAQKKIIDDCVAANFNMIRIWGGGYYGSDYLYDLCDENGILVWQDFMFACLMYPFYEEKFLSNVLSEVKYNVGRIMHHASLALWCGNNEIEFMFTYLPEQSELVKWYRKFFYEILPAEIRKQDRKTPYIETSPIGDGFRKNITADKCGDTHMWHVWHGGKNLKYYTKRYTRFMSEYGMESLPSTDCIEQFADKDEMNLFSKTMLHHQKCLSGNAKMKYYLLERYKEPDKFDDLIYLTGLTQSRCVGNAAEHFRRNKGRCNGSLWWQLNDCWGCPSWSSVDYFGKWKPLMYEAKRFFSPIALSINELHGNAEVFLLNDTLESGNYAVKARIMDFDGKTLSEVNENIYSKAGEPKKAAVISAAGFDKKKCFMIAELYKDGEKIFETTTVFAPERMLELKRAKIKAYVCGNKLTLESSTFARSVFVDIKGENAPLSDNSFDIIPGEQKVIYLEKDCKINPKSISVKCVNNVKSSHTDAERIVYRLKFSAQPENIANMFYYTFS